MEKLSKRIEIGIGQMELNEGIEGACGRIEKPGSHFHKFWRRAASFHLQAGLILDILNESPQTEVSGEAAASKRIAAFANAGIV